jgi:hypothetical protein
MISVELAQKLREAGLVWQPTERDHFAVPNLQMDNQVFVVSQLTALLQKYNGHPVVTFHGSSEWALDYIMMTDVVWMPSESQLREALAEALGPDAMLSLDRYGAGYRCRITQNGEELRFEAFDAEAAYARALLHVLRTTEQPTGN